MSIDNPAYELHDLLKSWTITPAGTSVLGYRAPDGDPASWFPPHARALELLSEIENHLEIQRRRNPHREPGLASALVRLRRGIFCTNVAMDDTPNGPRRHFQEEDLQILAAAGDGWNRQDAPIESLREMATVATLARDLVAATALADEGVRNYLGDVINALEAAAMEAAIYGGAPVGRLALELSAALEVYVPLDENGETRGNVIARLRKLAKDFTIYFAIPYTSQLAAAATMLALQPPTG